MPECNVAANKAKCNCTYEPCSKKGLCCQCLRYHWQRRELPACLFPDDAEKTYDRSLAAFIRAYRK